MKFMSYKYLSNKVKENISDYMLSYGYDDMRITRLFCFYDSRFDEYTDFTSNIDDLIENIDNVSDSSDIIEIDLTGYYLNSLKHIVKQTTSCNNNIIEKFNLIAKILMNYVNYQVLNSNYLLYEYIDIVKTIFKLKEVIE